MRLRFSQAWAKRQYEKRIRELIKFVKGRRACPDLLVKVFFYRYDELFNGNYRNAWNHGFYNQEAKLLPKITHIITLKVCEDKDFDERFIGIFAHEFKHYLDFKRFRGQRRKWEVRAEKFSKQMVEKWKQNHNPILLRDKHGKGERRDLRRRLEKHGINRHCGLA
jgi:hypothetical protein